MLRFEMQSWLFVIHSPRQNWVKVTIATNRYERKKCNHYGDVSGYCRQSGHYLLVEGLRTANPNFVNFTQIMLVMIEGLKQVRFDDGI